MKLQVRYKKQNCSKLQAWIAEAPNASEIAGRNTCRAKFESGEACALYDDESIQYAESLLVDDPADGATICDRDSSYYQAEDYEVISICRADLAKPVRGGGDSWQHQVAQEILDQIASFTLSEQARAMLREA